MRNQSSPRAGGSANAGGYYRHSEYPTKSTVKQTEFPFCEYRREWIIDELREDCPFAKPEPGWAAFEFEQEGFRGFGSGGARVSSRYRGQTCGDCVRRNMVNPVIQSIRLRIGADCGVTDGEV